MVSCPHNHLFTVRILRLDLKGLWCWYHMMPIEVTPKRAWKCSFISNFKWSKNSPPKELTFRWHLAPTFPSPILANLSNPFAPKVFETKTNKQKTPVQQRLYLAWKIGEVQFHQFHIVQKVRPSWQMVSQLTLHPAIRITHGRHSAPKSATAQATSLNETTAASWQTILAEMAYNFDISFWHSDILYWRLMVTYAWLPASSSASWDSDPISCKILLHVGTSWENLNLKTFLLLRA